MAENVVHQLIMDRNVEEVTRLLKSPKGPELARQKDEEGNLPLHHVAALSYPKRSLFWSTIDLLLQIHPEGLKEKNQNGNLPLHIITKRRQGYSGKFGTLRVAKNFLRIYPEGAGVKDDEGLLPIEHDFQANRFDFVQLIAKYYPKCVVLQVCHCPLAKTRWCIDCNDKHPLMTRIREYGKSSISDEEISNILRVLNVSLGTIHHPDDVHKILQLENSLASSEHSLASEKQQVKDLKLRLGDFENKTNENNENSESQKERNQFLNNLKIAHTNLQAENTKTQQHFDSEKQRNQTLNTENATLQAQVTEIQQQLDDNERKNCEQIEGILSLLVESGAEVIKSCSNLPIPSLKYLIKILCRRLDELLLSDGGDDRKLSFAQSVGTYLVEDENASRVMLMQCIQTLFSECAQAEGGDDQDAAEQCATTASAHTSGAVKRDRNDNSSDHRYSQDEAAGSTTTNKRARVSVSPEQEQT
jgi:hypothetical protein